MSKGISGALRLEALEYMRNTKTIKAMVSSGKVSEAGAKEKRVAILLKLSGALEREGSRARGRPKFEELDVAKPLGVLYQADPAKRPRGRPEVDKLWWFAMVYQTVEEERVRLAAQRKSKGTVTAAINSILEGRLAPAMSWNKATAREKFESMRADYRRGKALAKEEGAPQSKG